MIDKIIILILLITLSFSSNPGVGTAISNNVVN